jgi:very-short-patch-repair endonuclease
MGVELATTYILIALGVVLLATLLSRLVSPSAPAEAPPVRGDDLAVWPFEPMPLMTASEVRFFERLQDALPEYFIFSQVQLSRLIQCNQAAEQKFWLNRINRMSADFVVVDDDAQTVLVVIELDDWTHDRPDRVRADRKKDKALASAGLPILRFDGRRMPGVPQLRSDVQRAVATRQRR